jgi:hypothetical protein
MTQSTSQRTITLSSVNVFTICALFLFTRVNQVGKMFNFIIATARDLRSNPDTLYVDDLGNTSCVTDMVSFRKFANPWLAVPLVNLIVRMMTGKSQTNLLTYYESLQTQGLRGISLVKAFWSFLDHIAQEHAAALVDPTVLNYVRQTVYDAEGILTVKGDVPVTNLQALAVETILLPKYSKENSRLVITFEVPILGEEGSKIIGLTPFFGNAVATARFTTMVSERFNEIEAEYGNTSRPWQVSGHVVSTATTSIPDEDRSVTLNRALTNALSEIGSFKSEGELVTT